MQAPVTSLAEIYVQGVSTRRVIAITKQLRLVEISAMQASRAAVQSVAVLQEWRERSVLEITYLDLDDCYGRYVRLLR